MPSGITVQDTRAWAAPRVPVDVAGAPVLRHLEPVSAAAQAHAAASSGVPGWCEPPRLTDASRINCRIMAVAEEADPSLTRADVLKRSATTRTGIMPVRLGFADRVAAVILLVNTAFHRQFGLFREAQFEMRRAAPAAAHASMLPEDMATFEFVLQWRELRDELTSALRRHYESATRAYSATPGTQEYYEASVVAQRTSPEVLVQALSGMTIFDAFKWGVYVTPWDEEDAAAAAADEEQEDEVVEELREVAPAIAVSPPPPPMVMHVTAAAHASSSSAATCSGMSSTMMMMSAPLADNGSFIPSPSGASSRPGSPTTETAHSSFGSAPADYASPSSYDVTPVPPHHSAAPSHDDADGAAVASSVVAQVASPAGAGGCARRFPTWPGVIPPHFDALAAAISRIERPERAESLSDCLDADSIAERQLAAANYRIEMLRVCGAAHHARAE